MKIKSPVASTSTPRQTNTSSTNTPVSLYLLRNPFKVVYYLFLYTLSLISDAFNCLAAHLLLLSAFLILAIALYTSSITPGIHKPTIDLLIESTSWYGWWIMLGIASSIGLGTGLHTFVLFLGPLVANVTLTAYQCGSLDFSTHGPKEFICRVGVKETITLVKIFMKIARESFFWGFGTAIGELPPYFFARGSANSGEQDGFSSVEELSKKKYSKRTISEKIQVYMMQMMKTLGFWGILLAASIPNPLFDLAGIMCGHFAIPFYTFFGATFIGKALIKSSIQSIFIIVLSSKESLEFILKELKLIFPFAAPYIESIITTQIQKHTKGPLSTQIKSFSVLSLLWDTLFFAMIGYFIKSIVEASATTQYRRMHLKDKEVIVSESSNLSTMTLRSNRRDKKINK